MNTKDLLRLIPGVMVLASAAITYYLSPWGLALTLFVGLNLVQSAVTKWCMLEKILLKLGVPDGNCCG